MFSLGKKNPTQSSDQNRTEPGFDDAEPTGMGPLRGTPTGIIKHNKKLLFIVAGGLIVAAVVATTTFNGQGTNGTKSKEDIGTKIDGSDKPVTFNRSNQWYAKHPDVVAGLDSTTAGTPPTLTSVNGQSAAGTPGNTPTQGAAGVPDLTGQAVSPIESATASKTNAPALQRSGSVNGLPGNGANDAALQQRRQVAEQAREAARHAPLSAEGFTLGGQNPLGAANALSNSLGVGGATPALNPLAAIANLANKSSTGGSSSGSTTTASPTNDPNMQDKKEAFLGKDSFSGSSRVASQSPYMLMSGAVIPAVMISGINSDLPGQVIAQVRENVYDSATGRYLLIPQGARLVGGYDSRVAYGQNRLLIAWRRIIFPDGSSVDLKGMPGTDFSGLAGFEDIVHSHYGRIFGASILMSGITAGVELSQRSQQTTSGYASTGSTLSSALGQQLGQTGMALTQRNLNVQPTLIVRSGYRFNVMVTGDLRLPPMTQMRK